MGRYDSSKYRVVPFMEAIKNNLEYLNRFVETIGVSGLGMPCCACYGDNEMHLKPSKQHLLKLIDYIAAKDFGNMAISNKKRKLLCLGNPCERKNAGQEAKRQLETYYATLKPTSKAWYIFEGYTNPDIYIEGNDYIVICEGKWTEPHITTETTNLLNKNGESGIRWFATYRAHGTPQPKE